MSLPIFDPATPKVSILAIGMQTLASANELVAEAGQQAAKFQVQATDKAEFMQKAYASASTAVGVEAVYCTLANATGVRLEFFEEGSTGLLPEYKPPTIVEPGAVASFLVEKLLPNEAHKTFALKYNIQTFQGPMRGWVAGEPKDAVIVNSSNSRDLIDQSVFVTGTYPPDPKAPLPAEYPSQIFFDVYPANGDHWQIFAKQLIDQTPTGNKA